MTRDSHGHSPCVVRYWFDLHHASRVSRFGSTVCYSSVTQSFRRPFTADIYRARRTGPFGSTLLEAGDNGDHTITRRCSCNSRLFGRSHRSESPWYAEMASPATARRSISLGFSPTFAAIFPARPSPPLPRARTTKRRRITSSIVGAASSSVESTCDLRLRTRRKTKTKRSRSASIVREEASSWARLCGLRTYTQTGSMVFCIVTDTLSLRQTHGK